MRNRAEYEGALDVDDRLVSDLISPAAELRRRSAVCRPSPTRQSDLELETLLL